MKPLAILALPALAMMSACGGGADSAVSSEEGNASGAEVVEGTISDSMVALDQTTDMAPVTDDPILPPKPKIAPVVADSGDEKPKPAPSTDTPDEQPRPPRGAPERPSEEPSQPDNVSTEPGQ